MKKYLLLSALVFAFSMRADCFVGPNGINQWRLVYEVGQCLNSTTDQLDTCCSILEKTITALDLGFLTLIDFAALTLVEPLVSILESCDLCSHFEFIISQLDVLDSASDVCCAYLSTQDVIIKSDIDSVSTKTDSIGSQISQLKSDLDACCKSLSASDLACCAYLSTQDVIIKSDIDSVSTKTDSIGSQISFLNSDLDACCRSLSALDVNCCAYLSTQDVIIKSDIDSVSTKADSIGSQISFLNSDLDACCSTLSTLDVIIKSDLDACCSSMSSVLNQLDTCLLGTVITQAMIPYTISSPGVYTVCGDLLLNSGPNPAITISNTRDVRLDLNGHRVFSSPNSATAFAISVVNSQEVAVTNGALGATFTTTAKVSNSSNQIRFSDINVVASGSTAFDIEDSTDVTLERCNCTGSAIASNPVITIGGTSDGISLKSCTVFDARSDAFSVNVTPATRYGIFFEDCHALNTTGFVLTGNGFFVTTNGDASIPISFKGCTATFYGFGFLISSSNNVYFEECSTTSPTALGFDLISCSDFVLAKCDSVNSPISAFTLDTCQRGILSASNAVGAGLGHGCLLNSCSDILLDSCSMQQFDFNGYEFDASPRITAKNCVAQDCGFSASNGGYYVGSASDSTLFVDCVAQANSTGFVVLANTAVLESCAVTQNNIGVNIIAGASATELLDTCPVNNITSNITDNGTNTMNVSECTISDCCSRVESVVDQLDTCILGTVITQAMIPYTISSPGVYTVCGDLLLNSGPNPAITISNTRDVRLDLNGHRVYSSPNSATAFAISIVGSQEVAVTNGALGATFTTTAKVSNSSNQIRFSDINVVASGSTAFDIEDSTDVTLERCNCTGSAIASNPVITIGGTSDGIFLSSCTVFDARVDAFNVNVTPATRYGIFFEDCHALNTRATLFSGNGFFVTTNGNSTIPISFKRCTATFYGFGFLVLASSNVYFEDCSTTSPTALGFDLISCSDIFLDKCDSLGAPSSAFKFDACSIGTIQNSAAIGFSGGAFGDGVLLNSCNDICIDSCNVQKFLSNGYEFDASPRITAKNCIAEDCGIGTSKGGYYIGSASDSTLCVDCVAQANSTGFVVLANTAVLESCAVTQNNIGVNIIAGASATELLDTCPVNNITSNITDNGTNTMNVSECTISACCSRVESVVDQLDTCLLGTVITQAMVPFTISSSGVYTVCQNLSVSGGTSPAIAISGVSGVVLNLNGYQVSSTSGTANAISLTSAHDVTIYNGAVNATADTAVALALCSQITFSDIAVTASNPTAFDIENCFNVTLERINCANSTGSTNAVINVGGTSDGIFLKSCTVLDSVVNAFTVNVTPGNGHGIFFEDCHALRTNGSPVTAIGFSVTTSGNDTPIYFTDCTTKFYAFGFMVSESTGVMFKGCSAISGFAAGYNLITCADFVMENCAVSGPSNGFRFDASNHGVVYASQALDGAGFGYLLNTCVDILLQYCDAQNYRSAGFQLAVTQAVLDTCTAMNSSTGVSVTTNSIATVRRCEIDSNVTGINAHSTTSSTDVIIKDCMVAHNTVNGIVDNGTPIWILDTRSINPGPDSIAASTGAGTVITY